MNRFSPDGRNDFDRLTKSDATSKAPRPDACGPVSADAPWIKVHVLSEFIYCHRAGQIAFEKPSDDTGEECLAPQLDYLPNYDLLLIREELDRIRKPLTTILLFSVPSFVIWLFVLLQVHFATGVIIATALLWFVAPILCGMIRTYFVLHRRLRDSAMAPAIGIKFDIEMDQPINWWGLLKAGMESIELREPLRDSTLKLIGKPWRVLQYGSHRIPVIRKKHEERRIFAQQRARLAAYAYLIETCEAANVPYGIVLFGDSHEGIAIPITNDLKQQFRQLLTEFRRQLKAVAFENLVPAPPETAERCRNCPCAAFRLFIPNKSESWFAGEKKNPHLIELGRGVAVHCDCGDRFDWRPPS